MICTDTTMLGFTIVWLFGIACGLGVAGVVATFAPLFYRILIGRKVASSEVGE